MLRSMYLACLPSTTKRLFPWCFTATSIYLLDIPIRAQDEETAIPPRAESIGSEPVQLDIGQSSVSAQYHVAEILK